MKLVKGKQIHRDLSVCKGRQQSKKVHAPEKLNGASRYVRRETTTHKEDKAEGGRNILTRGGRHKQRGPRLSSNCLGRNRLLRKEFARLRGNNSA